MSKTTIKDLEEEIKSLRRGAFWRTVWFSFILGLFIFHLFMDIRDAGIDYETDMMLANALGEMNDYYGDALLEIYEQVQMNSQAVQGLILIEAGMGVIHAEVQDGGVATTMEITIDGQTVGIDTGEACEDWMDDFIIQDTLPPVESV